MTPSVIVTRPEGPEDGLEAAFAAFAIRVHRVPMLAVEPCGGQLPDPARFDWVVVTSANGARRFREVPATVYGARWAAVGPATRAALQELGIQAEVMPPEPTAAAIPEAISQVASLTGRSVLLVRGDLAGTELPQALERLGAKVVDHVAYRTRVGPASSRKPLEKALADPDVRAVILASGSAAAGFRNLHPGPPPLDAVTIGPSTTREATRLGFRVVAEALQPTVPALVEATVNHLA